MNNRHWFVNFISGTYCLNTRLTFCDNLLMKKKLVYLFLSLAVLAYAFAGDYAVLDGTVTDISKYGNLTISVLVSEAEDEGYETGDLVSLTVGDWSSITPVGTSYSDVDSGKPIVRFAKEYIEAAINYGSLAKTTGAGTGTPVTISMAEKEGYADEYIIRHLTRTEEREDYSSDEVFANFRAVKAGNIKENWLYRSCNPILDDAMAPYADKLAQDAGIKTAINLADKEERLSEVSGSYYSSLIAQGNVIALDLGVDFFSQSFTDGLRKGFLFMLDHPGPYLLHCNEGKDRAGLTAALLEAFLGASEEEIINDYMLSFKNYFGTEEGTRQYEAISKVINDFLAKLGDEETIQESAEAYIINTIGLTEAEANALKESLT